MRYAIDCEFIDTPVCSALISFAIVREDFEFLYFEFDYPAERLTEWLTRNVVPHLQGRAARRTLGEAAHELVRFTRGDPSPSFWAYYGAYDWYWTCRIFGGLLRLPDGWPQYFHEYRHVGTVSATHGPQHFALADARSLMEAMVAKGVR